MKRKGRKNINFRQTKSERSATDSYRGFKNVIRKEYGKN